MALTLALAIDLALGSGPGGGMEERSLSGGCIWKIDLKERFYWTYLLIVQMQEYVQVCCGYLVGNHK